MRGSNAKRSCVYLPKPGAALAGPMGRGPAWASSAPPWFLDLKSSESIPSIIPDEGEPKPGSCCVEASFDNFGSRQRLLGEIVLVKFASRIFVHPFYAARREWFLLPWREKERMRGCNRHRHLSPVEGEE